MKRNKQRNDPFEDLLGLRDDLFVSDLQKLVVPVAHDFGQTGVFDVELCPDFNALGAVLACAALVSRYEELMRLKESLDSHEKLAEAISQSDLFVVSPSGLSPYACIAPAIVNMIAGGVQLRTLEQVLSRMGCMVISAYAMLAEQLDYSMPKSVASAADMSAYIAAVEKISMKLAAAIEKRRVDAANGKKGGDAKSKGDVAKKVLKKVNAISKKVGAVDSRVRMYHDDLVENSGRGVTVKSPANEKLINAILDRYGDFLKLEKYSGKGRRNALTDAMNAILAERGDDLAGFKDPRSLRSELTRERAKWDAKYAEQMTDQMVSEPDFSHK